MEAYLAFIEFFCKSFIVGVLISIPIGPVALVCIKKTIDYGIKIGIISGLGSATADFFYAAIVGFGLTYVSNFFIEHQFYLQLAGAIFLLYLGVKSLIHQSKTPERNGQRNLVRDFMATFLLSLSNPFTLLIIITLLAGLGVGDYSTTSWNDFAVPCGIFTGELTWWVILVITADYVERRLGSRIIPLVNRISGITLLLLAAAILIRLLFI